jgi:NADPH-dependent 2,4-dienoyl-CoA reductase/sulfur reductase-like enzyme
VRPGGGADRLGEAQAERAGLEFVSATIESTTKAGYFPGTRPMSVKMLAEVGTGRLLGAQIVGREGSAKRIDTCAIALWNEMSVDELAMSDLSYAPPFSSVWDPVQVAARAVSGKVGAVG